MFYEVWDDGNRLGEYPSKERALAAVRSLVEEDPSWEESLILVGEQPDGRSIRVAAGRELARLAKAERHLV
jgi:hypothetical protein